MAAGQLRDRVTFQQQSGVPDGGGGSETWWTDIMTVWGSFRPERGRERLEAGRLEAALGGTLKIRSSNQARQLTSSDRVVIRGELYQIRSISNPDRRDKFIEMSVERGVGQ